jgi:phospholipid/cholesterol/gamma-HCH transport system permease protein
MADASDPRPRPIVEIAHFLGSRLRGMLVNIGAVYFLLIDTLGWIWRSIVNKRVRIGKSAIVSQIVRIGVRSIFIIALVSACVGFILAFQMAPTLDKYGSRDLVANITGVAIFRELGPLIAAIVLTGFAGAAIAAEIGTMVVGEEIEALEAHALNPVRFLVVPRVIAAVISMTCLAVLGNLVAVTAGWAVGVGLLDIPSDRYIQNTLDQVKFVDFWTGIAKATIFGLLIGLIACSNGLRVTGGAAGVGNATTNTVVQSIVAIVVADLIFTYLFFTLGWN